MIQTAEQHIQREPPGAHGPGKYRLSREQIDGYLKSMETRGCTPETIKTYRRNLSSFYQALPADKTLCRESVANWRDEMLACGYMPRTVNQRLTSANGLLDYLGLREFQIPSQLRLETDDMQPELTRSEYLRMLSAARALDKERTYLLVKVFALTGLTIHELPKLTVAEVAAGHIVLMANRTKQIIYLPDCLKKELTEYACREHIRSGPVFVTRSGRCINRTGVTACIQQLAQDARVAPEKCNPRCLRKLYQSTRDGIRQNVDFLVDQAHERLLEQEQLTIGWGEVNGHAL